ncbi:MAG: mechanosensitive ion channel, partial [Desulfobacterales bacterium]
EINIGPLLAAIGAAGFIIGFALQGTLSNFAAGIMILIYRPFDVDDLVDIGGTLGKVDAMTIVSTTLKTVDNQIVVLPNNMIWGDKIINITGSDIRRVDMVFGIGYGDDIAKAQKILEEILRNHEATLKDPEPMVKVHELGDSSVNFVVRPWVKTDDYWDVYWDVTRKVKERFDAEGVSIPFPQRDVHMHQVATT